MTKSCQGQTRILVTIDSLRRDRVNMFDLPDMNLHDAAYSTAPATPGAMPAILTGEHATPGRAVDGTVLAERHGGPCLGVSANRLLSAKYGFDAGFDEFEAPGASDDVTGVVGEVLDDSPRIRAAAAKAHTLMQRIAGLVSEPGKSFRRASNMVDYALEWADWSDSPFIWLHFMEPHHPYDPDAGDIARHDASRVTRHVVAGNGSPREVETAERLYDYEVSATASAVERLVDRAPDDAAIVVAADHGELFGEHDRYGHPPVLVPKLVRIPLWYCNTPVPPVVSGVDIPSMLFAEEIGDGDLDREVAHMATADGAAGAADPGCLVSDAGVFEYGNGDVDRLRGVLGSEARMSRGRSDMDVSDLEALGYI